MESKHQPTSCNAAMDFSTVQSFTLPAMLHQSSACCISTQKLYAQGSDTPCRDYCFGLSIWSEGASVVTGLIVMITMRYLQVPLVESLPGG